jgi:hypothetical protein
MLVDCHKPLRDSPPRSAVNADKSETDGAPSASARATPALPCPPRWQHSIDHKVAHDPILVDSGVAGLDNTRVAPVAVETLDRPMATAPSASKRDAAASSTSKEWWFVLSDLNLGVDISRLPEIAAGCMLKTSPEEAQPPLSVRCFLSIIAASAGPAGAPTMSTPAQTRA